MNAQLSAMQAMQDCPADWKADEQNLKIIQKLPGASNDDGFRAEVKPIGGPRCRWHAQGIAHGVGSGTSQALAEPAPERLSEPKQMDTISSQGPPNPDHEHRCREGLACCNGERGRGLWSAALGELLLHVVGPNGPGTMPMAIATAGAASRLASLAHQVPGRNARTPVDAMRHQVTFARLSRG